MKIQIKNRWDGSVIFETDAETIGGAVAAAIAAKADLTRADLTGADLTRANLYGAKIPAEELPKLLSVRTIVGEGDLIGWKKLHDGTICKLLIPDDAKRIGGLIGRKCRAEFVKVLAGEGFDIHRGETKYTVGKIVRPDSFDPDPTVECSHGIHFFITRQEAEDYS